ncbi:MAG: hypothetical protein ACRDSK_10075 [Actinophytocola sp.]|uniref:hypothetical protein n=1 Tax=Actinophytocola sp. TaxID=1872138 RepID=UPI003D6BF3AB
MAPPADDEYAWGEPLHVGTPKLEELRRTARTQMELERLASEEDCAAIVDACDEAATRERLQRAEEQVARLAQLVADSATRPAEAALAVRRFAEAEHPETLVRVRRSADHARNLEAIEAEYDSARKALSEARGAATEIVRLTEARRAVARIRARRVHEHAWRRVAVYWRQLVRSHTNGDLLNDQLKPVGPDLPDWARDPDLTPVQETTS